MPGKGFIGWILGKIIPSLIPLGGGIDSVFNFARRIIPTIPLSNVAGYFRSYETAQQRTETIQTRRAEDLFRKEDLIETDMSLSRRYMVKYDFIVRDRITGEEYHQIRNSAESKLMSNQDFIDLGIQEFEKLFDRYKLDIVECSIKNVYHAKGWSY